MMDHASHRSRGLRRARLAAVLTALAAVAVAATLLALAAADGREGASGAPAPDRWDRITVDPATPYLPTLANAELAVGGNRLAFTLQDARGFLVNDVQVTVSLYDLTRSGDTPLRTQYAQFIDFGVQDPLLSHTHTGGSSVSDNTRSVGRGVYVAPVHLAHEGPWGLEFTMTPADGGAPVTVLVRFTARVRPDAPLVGEAAPRSHSRTLAEEPDLRRLTSDPAPEPGLYRQSIDAALDAGRPFLVAFATPAFCHSRACGPTLEVVKAVWREFSGQVDAIHVEVFENPQAPESLREAQAFLDWNLPSEPWVFVVDGEGRIAARFEGVVTVQELREAVVAALGP